MNHESEKPVVLIVDDTLTNLDVLIDALSFNGLNVSVARSGEEALERIEDIEPDIILLDVIMPGIDGFETCLRLKEDERTRDIPVIFMTALSETVDKVKGFDVGGVDYITKPFQHEEAISRIHAHLTIRKQQRELQELNASKDKFFSIIAHDLKNPMIAFLSYVDLLESIETVKPEEFKDYTKQFRKTAENLFNLLENLLTWSRLQHGTIVCRPQKLHVDTLIQNSITLLAPNARQKHINVLYEPQQPGLWIYADMDMIDTVIRNLLSNAIKFTHPNGTITLTAALQDDMIQIAVADTGVGIPEEKCDALFQIHAKYTRNGTAGERGTGLGLILCKEFVENNGGKIAVESHAGEGTRFTVTLPRAEL